MSRRIFFILLVVASFVSVGCNGNPAQADTGTDNFTIPTNNNDLLKLTNDELNIKPVDIPSSIVGSWAAIHRDLHLIFTFDDTRLYSSGDVRGYVPYAINGDIIRYTYAGKPIVCRIRFNSPDEMEWTYLDNGYQLIWKSLASMQPEQNVEPKQIRGIWRERRNQQPRQQIVTIYSNYVEFPNAAGGYHRPPYQFNDNRLAFKENDHAQHYMVTLDDDGNMRWHNVFTGRMREFQRIQ